MEKVKVSLVILFFLFISHNSHSQSIGSAPFIRKSLMSMSGGLGGGIFLYHPVQNIYFTGSFSYCMEDRIGIRSDFYLFIPDVAIGGQLDRNSTILLGPEFHFPAGHLDWTILFQPGLSFSYLKDEASTNQTQAEPVLTLSTGLTYYFFHNFHLGVNAQYLRGNYFSESIEPYNISELRFTAALGVNLFVNHQAAYQRKRPKF